jgi:hypothetical protein
MIQATLIQKYREGEFEDFHPEFGGSPDPGDVGETGC